MDLNSDVVLACVDLVGRCGASGLDIGFVNDDVPVEEAGWWAAATFQGAKISVGDRRSPDEACFALSQRLLADATCRCGLKVTTMDRPAQRRCRWRLDGSKWVPGCDAPPLKIEGERGDYAAIKAAMEGRRQ